MTVATRFNELLLNLTLTDAQRQNGIAAHSGVRACLNANYYGQRVSSANSMLVGSWGKNTEVRPPRDIDVLFVMPDDVRSKYQSFFGKNGPSQLLQDVKRCLLREYASTDIRGDGQVVVVEFERYAVEVVPVFKSGWPFGGYEVPDTNGGGKYTRADPIAEIAAVKASNERTKGNTRDLIRFAKCWQSACSVPLKSFWLELLAIDFLDRWTHSGNSSVYYDWMVRDFFSYLVGKAGLLASVTVPGTLETI